MISVDVKTQSDGRVNPMVLDKSKRLMTLLIGQSCTAGLRDVPAELDPKRVHIDQGLSVSA